MGNRRGFIKSICLGAAGSFGEFSSILKPSASTLPERSKVSLVNGTDRRKMVYDALVPFEEVIKKGIKGKQIIIKPNVVEDSCQLAVTHIDTLTGVLDFFDQITDKKIIIGESSSTPGKGLVNNTSANFSFYGYDRLKEKFNVEFLDFNQSSSTTVNWTTDYNSPKGNIFIPMNIADPYFDENNYFISLANMKTHWATICTLSMKNFYMSMPLNILVKYPDGLPTDYAEKYVSSEKSKMHLGSFKGLNYNIVRLAKNIRPKFSIIDGVVGMEGEGPTKYGTPINHGVMVAGPDMVSVDRIAIELMGIDYNYIKHVKYSSNAGLGIGDIDKIDILGPDIVNYIKKYKLPSSFELATKWTRSEPTVVEEFLPEKKEDDQLPENISVIVSNHPNPFNISTVIQVTLRHESDVLCVIYSNSGQRVRNLISSRLNAGNHFISWNGTDDNGIKMSSGIYIVKVLADNSASTHRMLQVK